MYLRPFILCVSVALNKSRQRIKGYLYFSIISTRCALEIHASEYASRSTTDIKTKNKIAGMMTVKVDSVSIRVSDKIIGTSVYS